MDKKLQELKESLASIDTNFKQIKADMDGDDKMNKLAEYFYDSLSRIREYMWQMEGNLYRNLDNHTNPPGAIHAPNLKTASHVQSYCDACGMGDDVEIVKPVIFVRASRNGAKEFTAEINIKKQ